MRFFRGVREALQGAVRRLLISRTGGIDLTKLDKIPERLSWPLNRSGVNPSARISAAREKDPVQRLTSLMGLEIWLITGYDEAREVLGNVKHSTDIRPYMGASGDVEKGDIGGLGFTDPPEHTRQRRLLTPEFTMRRLSRLKPAIEDIIGHQLDETESLGASAPDGVVDLAQTFAFPVPFRVICDLLGLPAEQRERFRKLGAARFDVTMGGAGAIGAIGGSREFLLAEAARQRHDPGPGLIGQIIRDNGDAHQRLRSRRAGRWGIQRRHGDLRLDARSGHCGAAAEPGAVEGAGAGSRRGRSHR